MKNSTLQQRSWLTRLLIGLMVVVSMQATNLQAAMIATETVLQTDTPTYAQSFNHAELLEALESEALQQQLTEMGVDPQQLEERIASLTAAEISQLNAQLEAQPAGEGFIGLLALIFIVFIITDALCATDLFNFVHCINR